MPKTTVERNSFVRGLITEATPLTFPENASIDERNFMLNRDGSRQRRLGMDYEASYSLIDTTKNSSDFASIAITSFKWDNVGDDATVTVGVVQVGNLLHLLDLSTTAPSSNVLQTVTLATKYNNVPLQYAVVKGLLVLASSADSAGPQYLERDLAGTFILGAYEVEVRDIWGVDDGLPTDTRPTTLSAEHHYNLLNQGWVSPNYNFGGLYASNADLQALGKNNLGVFNFGTLSTNFFGNTPAPKGRYIINAYNRGASRQTVSGVTTLPLDEEQGAATSVASFAGRVFYSGISSSIVDPDAESPSYTGTILFSRIVRNTTDLGVCYQEADPTSEHVSDLIATDGGSITIPEASNIYKLITNGATLVVIAENGVWQITGPDGVFRADDFSITQITNVGAMGPDSVVNAEGSIVYWSDGGIYVLSPDKASGRMVAQNLSESSIQDFYTAIPSIGRLYAKGNYDTANRKISWLYNDTEAYDGTAQTSCYNKELIFDTVLQAFYPYEIGALDTDSPCVAGYMPVTDFITLQKQDNVVSGGVNVVVNGEQVVVTSDVRSSGDSTTKYLVLTPDTTYTLTLGVYGNQTFLDWEAADNIGVDAPAYLVTGYEVFADSMRRKYVPYLTTHFKRTEIGFTDVEGDGSLEPINPSSCTLQAQWDFADSANSGKWGTPFQAYRLTRPYMPSGVGDLFDYGHVMITTKNRLRGSGKALSLRFDTEALHDLHVYGWAMLAEGNENV